MMVSNVVQYQQSRTMEGKFRPEQHNASTSVFVSAVCPHARHTALDFPVGVAGLHGGIRAPTYHHLTLRMMGLR